MMNFLVMSEDIRKPIFNLYVDDSGTRHPDFSPPTSRAGDWFALGGYLIKEEDEPAARQAYADFCSKWDITYPLHSIRIRHRSGHFKWLASLSQAKLREFYHDLTLFIVEQPIMAHGCVIDRPGYHTRYYEKYGRQRWHLCKTAFSILAERSAKFALAHDRRVRIFVEESDKTADRRIRDYFNDMRDAGMPFNKGNSGKYGPLTSDELRFRLVELRFKRKSSPMLQLADLVLYPLSRAAYDTLYPPMRQLIEKHRTIDQHLDEEQIAHMGAKYYCFD
jgi:hypothetical protein